MAANGLLKITLLLLSLAAAPAFASGDFRVTKEDVPAEWTQFLHDCASVIHRLQWDADNMMFYEELRKREFQDRTMTCGMHEYPDLMQPRLHRLLVESEARVWVEVGGGMGRVIKWGVQHTKIPVIISIERSHRYAALLRRLARQLNAAEEYERVTALPFNLLSFVEENKQESIVDIVTWLWWGFAEVHPADKPIAMSLLHRILKPGGTLVLEMPVGNPVPTAITEYQHNVVHFKMRDDADAPKLHLHKFSRTMLIKLATDAGLIYSGCEEYTANSKPEPSRRALCFFMKPHVLEP